MKHFSILSDTIAGAAFMWALLSYSPAPAQDEWVSISDDLCVEQGVWEGEGTWNRRTSGIMVDPATSDVYLVLCDKGLWKSSDFGETWTRVDGNGGYISGRCQTASAFNMHYPSGNMALFMLDGDCGNTTDKGGTWNTWVRVGRNWDSGDIDWSSGTPQTILAFKHESASEHMLSTNGGDSWSQIGAGTMRLGVAGPGTLLKGEGGIQRSTNQGSSWTTVAGYTLSGLHPVHYNDNLYWTCSEGVIVSSDAGQSWTLLGSLPNAGLGPYFGPTEDQMMVVKGDGFYVSDDRGETWTKRASWFQMRDGYNTQGLYNSDGHFFHFSWDATNDLLYASTLGGSAYRLGDISTAVKPDSKTGMMRNRTADWHAVLHIGNKTAAQAGDYLTVDLRGRDSRIAGCRQAEKILVWSSLTERKE